MGEVNIVKSQDAQLFSTEKKKNTHYIFTLQYGFHLQGYEGESALFFISFSVISFILINSFHSFMHILALLQHLFTHPFMNLLNKYFVNVFHMPCIVIGTMLLFSHSVVSRYL